MRDSSARMSSYWRSMYPAISWKLHWRTSHGQRDQLPASAFSQRKTYVNSLSMLSPNPGVSTIVNEILTPSSSSSARFDPLQSSLHTPLRRGYSPTVTGLILMPSSMCAVSGLSQTLCGRISDSQSVFTNVVRPVPDAPRWPCFQRRTEMGLGVRLTNDHDGELNTLFHILSAAGHGGVREDERRRRRNVTEG